MSAQMTSIELMRVSTRNGQMRYFADGRRISRNTNDMLEGMSKRWDTLYTTFTSDGRAKHHKTAYVAARRAANLIAASAC